MIFSQHTENNLEESIIEKLHKNNYDGPSLLETLRKNNPTLAKETFYRILRKLLSEEIVTKHSKIYELNHHWVQRIYKFSKKHIDESVDKEGVLVLKEGDKISYSFKNPNLMGIYWAHTYDTIFEQHDPKIPILVFHPHEWLIHTRKSSESFFLNRFSEDKKIVFFSIGGNTALDKQFKKDWVGKFRQITTGIDYGFKKTEYINVLGDFIFKVSVSKPFGDNIDSFFKKHVAVTDKNIGELETICNRHDRTRMVLIKSEKESERLHKKFKKYFFIP